MGERGHIGNAPVRGAVRDESNITERVLFPPRGYSLQFQKMLISVSNRASIKRSDSIASSH